MKCQNPSAVSVTIFFTLLFNCVVWAQSAPTDPSVTPIIIDIRSAKGPAVITLNNQVMTIPSLREWLGSTARGIGGSDPIVIRFNSDVTIGLLLQIKNLVAKTHDKVRLILDEQVEEARRQELFFHHSDLSRQP